MNSLRLLLLVPLLAFSACGKQPSGDSAGFGIQKTMNVIAQEWDDDAAKSSYEAGVGITLSGNESVGVYYNAYKTGADSQFGQGLEKAIVEATPSGEGKYTFAHSAISGAHTYNYYFLMPYRGVSTVGTHNKGYKPFTHLFAVQYPSATSYDPSFDYLIGKPVENVEASSEVVVDGFKRITAPFLLNIEDADDLLGGEKIYAVTMDFGGSYRLAGKFYTDHLDSASGSDIAAYSPSTCGSAITAVYPSGLAASGGVYGVWYMSLPVSLSAGGQVTVTVTGATRTIVLSKVLPVSVKLLADKFNRLTFRLTNTADVFPSVHQDFSTISSSPGTTFIGSDGNSRTWAHNCSGYGTSKKLVPSGLKMDHGEYITIPASSLPVKSIRVYAHEGTYSSSSATATLTATSGAASATAAYGTNDTNAGYVDLTFAQAQAGDIKLSCTYPDSRHSAVVSSVLVKYEEEKLEDMDIFLCIGQSNMAGRGIMQDGDDAVIPNVYVLDGNDRPIPAKAPLNIYSTVRKGVSVQGINPAWQFSKDVASETGRKILLVVNARGNTSIGTWKKIPNKELEYSQKESDDEEKWGLPIPGLYSEAVRRTKEAQKYGTLKGILWHQGEANHSTSQTSYQSTLAGLVSDLRSDLGVSDEDVPFVVGQIGQTTYEDGHLINGTLASVGDYVTNGWCASSQGCEMNSDNLHFSRAGQILLGGRYADIILERVYGIR